MTISDILISVANFVCGYPLFFVLIGGGLFLFFYSGFVSVRKFPTALKVLAERGGSSGQGQISPFQALMSEISSTVGMGNIAGVAIAITMGGPGSIFWMWISAIVGMSTKFFEGTLAIMFKGRDSAGEVQGGPMYVMTGGLGPKWKPMAYFFAVSALLGTLCVMQANQLVEAVTSVITTPMGIENTLLLRFLMGLVISVVVGSVIIGGIKRIANIASKIVPLMVILYFILVLVICIIYYKEIPGVFSLIFHDAFSLRAGFGGLAATALIGARRAAMVNEAGVGTSSMMHGASRNSEPVKEGLIAMVGPAIDSGLICTLTSIPILIVGNYADAQGIKGVFIALGAFGQLLPGYGRGLLMVILFFFAFSTMFSYSYYGQKCSNFLFGASNTKYYNYFYLAMLVVAAMIPLGAAVSLMDLAYAFMVFPNMLTLILLAPKVKARMKLYFHK
jgi:AGCS family alanine or glycine:cation symporter